jgi:hypothetical protein
LQEKGDKDGEEKKPGEGEEGDGENEELEDEEEELGDDDYAQVHASPEFIAFPLFDDMFLILACPFKFQLISLRPGL